MSWLVRLRACALGGVDDNRPVRPDDSSASRLFRLLSAVASRVGAGWGRSVGVASVTGVKGEVNFTRAGILNAAQHGITPAEAWEVVDSHERVVVPVGDLSRLILGFTGSGRGLAILVQEADLEDDVWDIVGVRELRPEEATAVRQVQRRRRG